jgi:DNA ligase (NAD+)
MDIRGLGDTLADRLVGSGLVRELSDLYHLTPGSLSGIERMGSKSAASLLAQLDASRMPPLDRMLAGLGIPGVGRVAAQALALRFGTLDGLAGASRDLLMTVEGIGPVLAESLHLFFRDPVTRGGLDSLLAAGVSPRAEEGSHGAAGSLAGLTIVFTGTIAIPREEARELAERHGAKVTESVSSSTSLVVAGPGAGSKIERARELGVRIADWPEFMEMIGP